MKFLGLRAKNFMSFRDIDYIFPATGLYFVGGEVKDGSMSSSNGAGKSVFLCEALSYGLFGRTIRNVGKDDVINRSIGGDCFAEVILEDDEGVDYLIKRYRRHREHSNDLLLFKSGKPATGEDVYKTQEIIDSILGMNWLVFSTAVIFGEKAKRFIEAGDTEKKEIFDEILMLYWILSAQQAVTADLKKLVEKKGTMEFGMGAAKMGLEEVRAELKTVEDSLNEFEKEKELVQKKIEEKTASVIDLDERMKTANGAHSEAQQDFEVLEGEIEKLYEHIKQLRREETEEMAKLQKITYAIHEKESPIIHKMSEIEEWLNNKDDLPKGTRCSVCGSEITVESVVGCAKHYQEELGKLHPLSMKLQKEHQKASAEEGKAAEKWRKEIEKTEKTLSELDKEKGKQKDITYEAKSDLLKLENNVKMIKQEIEHLESDYRERETRLLQTQKRLEEKIFDYEDKIKTMEKEMAESEEETKYLKFWIEGFSGRGIKSLLLDEILPQLNTRIDYYGSVLLDNVIHMEFDTETTLKSGDTRDKFNIKLFTESEQIDYKSCSSGEKGRIDAAVLLALQSLIFERSACASSLVIFDEVFEHLDSIGIERMVNLLNEEAQDKAIFVISHQNEFADYFDNMLMIRKEKGISVLEA